MKNSVRQDITHITNIQLLAHVAMAAILDNSDMERHFYIRPILFSKN